MPVLPALIPGPAVQLVDAGRSANLDAGTSELGTLWLFGLPRFGTWAFTLGAMVGGARPTTRMESFGDLLFDRVLVIPRTSSFPSVVSDIVYSTEVWNASRNREYALTSISRSGDAGVSAQGPTAMSYGPGQSQLYTITVSGQGASRLSATVTWSFTGVVGADQVIDGSRLVAFSPAMDWSEPFREVIADKTDVLKGRSRAEQRRPLRTHPRYAATYRVVTITPLDTAFLESLVQGWQGKIYGVPWWPEQSFLDADVAAGGFVLPVDTTDRPSFEAGGLALIWRDARTWEAATVESLTTGSITLTTALVQGWSAGCKVVPLRRGRLLTDQTLGRPTNWVSAGSFSFTCEGV